MKSLFTVAFPEVPAEASAFMRPFLHANSPAAQVSIAPHFTLAFGCSDVPEGRYQEHVAAVAARTKPIHFKCKYAMLGIDNTDDRTYVFLVPDEGNAAVSLLHDALYTGPLSKHLRLDRTYTPHITLATLRDRQRAKDLCDELNHGAVLVEGNIRELTVGAIATDAFEVLATFKLGA